MHITKRQTSNIQGFTIVELMIALSVLSVILIMSTVILIQIGALYSKGVNAANLQNNSRTVAADVSAAIQFSGNAPSIPLPSPPLPGQEGVICIGNIRYSFILKQELGYDSGVSPTITTPHVLWRDTMKNNNCSPIGGFGNAVPSDSQTNGDGYEMVGAHTRLVNFAITQQSGTDIYILNTSMAYGDSDLFNPVTGNCNGGAGEQFCGTSQITTQLTRRTL